MRRHRLTEQSIKDYLVTLFKDFSILETREAILKHDGWIFNKDRYRWEYWDLSLDASARTDKNMRAWVNREILLNS